MRYSSSFLKVSHDALVLNDLVSQVCNSYHWILYITRQICNTGLIENYAIWLSGHESSYWNNFDKMIKLPVILIIILNVLFPTFWKQNHFKSAPSGLRQLFTTQSPLKIMKNDFYFTLKFSLFSKYLNFCLDFLLM